jgi:DNA-binding winged helix-turn-helix (wHTH) protein
MEQREILTFGAEYGEPFRLETRIDAHRQQHLKLYQGAREIRHKNLLHPTLLLLRHLAKNFRQDLFEGDILNLLWPEGRDEGLVEKHISALRGKDVLNDQPPHRFIKTIPRHGYRFLADVRVEGNLGGIQIFEKWNRPRFYELLGAVERGREDGSEDLRIVTTVFNSSISELGLDALLQKRVRIKILMMNPENEPLMHARFSLRKDAVKHRILQDQRQQIADLKKLASQHPPSSPIDQAGTLEFRVSDIMPPGFVAHSLKWALYGVFLAQESYVAGPLLEIRADTELWRQLHTDWKLRWADAQDLTRKKQQRGD